MSLNLNRVTICGNLVRDPELRYTPKGAAVCDVSLAVNRNWKDEAGNKQEEVTFIDVTAFGKVAETVATYMVKGAPAYFEGRLKLEQWDDKTTGQKRSKLKVIAESFQFVESRKDGDKAPAANRAPAPTPAAAPVSTNGECEDSDVPF